MMMTQKVVTRSYEYFSDSEFARCSPPCSINQLSPVLLDRLSVARERAGIPFVITSAYRSREYEIKHGRNGSSSHCLGLAIDIKCTSSFQRYYMVKALLECGFYRIGVYPRHIHVDIDSSKNDCLFLGSYV